MTKGTVKLQEEKDMREPGTVKTKTPETEIKNEVQSLERTGAKGRKKKLGRKGIVLLMLTAMLISLWQAPLNSEAASVSGKWIKESRGWWFKFPDGTYAKNEYINGYWLNSKGWYEEEWNGSWKHNAKGWWFQAGSWYPKNRWLRINRKDYYFNAQGYMVTNQWIGRYYVDKTGAWTKTRSSSSPIVTPQTTQLATPVYPSGSAAANWGALKVSGTNLCSSSGAKVQLKGVSTFGIIWDEGRYNINQDAFSTLKTDWGANLIRLAVYTQEYGGYCNDNDSVDTSTLDTTIANAVSYATKLGMYIIIDWHILNDGNPNTYITRAKQFFANMSYKYSNYDNVLYEIYNEPNGSTTWSDVKSYADTIIPIIRENDDDAIIIVGTPTWSQDVDQVAANPVAQSKNVMYTLHFYAATHKDAIRKKLTDALAQGTPVFITEFSTCESSGNGSVDYTSAAAWKTLINNNNISYAGWSLCNKAESSAIIKNSCSKHSGWTDSDLTETGLWLKNLIKGN